MCNVYSLTMLPFSMFYFHLLSSRFPQTSRARRLTSLRRRISEILGGRCDLPGNICRKALLLCQNHPLYPWFHKEDYLQLMGSWLFHIYVDLLIYVSISVGWVWLKIMDITTKLPWLRIDEKQIMFPMFFWPGMGYPVVVVGVVVGFGCCCCWLLLLVVVVVVVVRCC